MISLEELQALAKKRLSKHRYQHTKAVAKQAKRLAAQYGADEQLCMTAAWLHDITKEEDMRKQLQKIRASAIIKDDIFLQSPPLYHAETAYLFAKELGITEEEVLNAIRYHTSARAGMSVTEQIVYLADATSQDRTYPGVQRLRKRLQQSLQAAMLMALQEILRHLVQRKQPIPKDTMDAYHEYCLWDKQQKREEHR